MKLPILYSLLIFLAIPLTTKTSIASDLDFPLKMGNFILPGSQQPGSLFSFGENILDKDEKQFSLFSDYYNGDEQDRMDTAPQILYGVTNQFTILLSVPIVDRNCQQAYCSAGFADAALQLEYAFYQRKTIDFISQATVVVNTSVPTGSSTKQPPTGKGAPSYFLGVTYSRLYQDWFGLTSHGVILSTQKDNNKSGHQFLYQAGLGRNIMDINSKWIFAGLVEADGQYNQKDTVNGAQDPNSGGNTVYIIPSLWISSRRLIIQPGFGLPVIQHLFGNQLKNKYLILLNLSWSFYGSTQK